MICKRVMRGSLVCAIESSVIFFYCIHVTGVLMLENSPWHSFNYSQNDWESSLNSMPHHLGGEIQHGTFSKHLEKKQTRNIYTITIVYTIRPCCFFSRNSRNTTFGVCPCASCHSQLLTANSIDITFPSFWVFGFFVSVFFVMSNWGKISMLHTQTNALSKHKNNLDAFLKGNQNKKPVFLSLRGEGSTLLDARKMPCQWLLLGRLLLVWQPDDN